LRRLFQERTQDGIWSAIRWGIANGVGRDGEDENVGYEAGPALSSCTVLGGPNGNAILAAIEAATANRP
jgi:hypothetical protein